MPKQTLRLSAFGELKACGNNCAPFLFLIAHWGTYGYIYLWSPGVEIADETVTASRNASAMLSFLPRHVWNGLACSVCNGFDGSSRSGYRKKCIGTM